jgi:nitroreductase
MNQSIAAALNRRYATKAFDPNKKISDADFASIQNALRMAPSSYGIQPWTFVWVQDKEKRAQVRAASFNQPQTVDADRLLIVAIKTDLAGAIDHYVSQMAAASGKAEQDFAQYKGMMHGTATNKGLPWFQRQAYIALGFGLQTAALLGVDACPMEGFDPDALNKILGLTEKGLTATVMLALGYGIDGGSPNQHHKFRFGAEAVHLTV